MQIHKTQNGSLKKKYFFQKYVTLTMSDCPGSRQADKS